MCFINLPTGPLKTWSGFACPALLPRSQFKSGTRRTATTNANRWRAQYSPCSAISWNVNSIRALLRKNPSALKDLAIEYNPLVLCLQETKLQKHNEADFHSAIGPGWMTAFNSSTGRLGYSGTAVYSRNHFNMFNRHTGHTAGDAEGRVTTIVLENCFVVCVYTLNSGEDLKRLQTRLDWDSVFRMYIRSLRTNGKPVIVLGDLNVARSDIDVYSEKECLRKPGYSQAERESFEETLETCGLVDIFRELYPTKTNAFTAWEYKTRARGRNNGMRIDYALVSEDMVGAVRDVRILDHIEGSDHCPVIIDLEKGFL